ncbi:MAG: HflX GTPase family protein, partial [Paraclostridium sp.]
LKENIIELNGDIIVADDELTNLQLKTLRKMLGLKVIGRTRMILQVLYQRAQEEDTRLLIEMIRMKYYLPLVSEEEKDEIRQRMMVLHEHINRVDKIYKQEKENRIKLRLPTISIVGYTNAGKTSLMNLLCEKEAYAENELMSTIDPLINNIKLPSGKDAIIADTIGFIRKLPYTLVKLIHLPLSEIEDADVIIHLIDISDENYKEKLHIVNDTLNLMKIDESKVIEVFNKCDLIDTQDIDEDNIYISVKEKINIDYLLGQVEEVLKNRLKKFKIKVPHDKSNIISILYDYAEEISEEACSDGVILKGYIHKNKYNNIESYMNTEI